MGFKREIQAISNAVDTLVINENKADFFSTMMYTPSEPKSYTDSSGAFIKKYLKVSRYCGDNNGNCFAPKYYEFKDNDKIEYKPEFKGACAILKNGMSLCLLPQIGNQAISGIIDINGKKGPNVKDKDLLTFSLSAKNRIGMSKDTEEVYFTPKTGLKPETNGGGGEETEPTKSACELEPDGLDCCKTKATSITSATDPCCTYEELKNSIGACKEEGGISITAEPISSNSISIKIYVDNRLEPDELDVWYEFLYFVDNGYSTDIGKYEETWTLPNYAKFLHNIKTNTYDYKTSISTAIDATRGPYPINCEISYKGKDLYKYYTPEKYKQTMAAGSYNWTNLNLPCTNLVLDVN